MARPSLLPPAFFQRSARQVARDLLGRYLVRQLGGEEIVVRLVETEAYLGAEDPASHAYRGHRSARTESLYLPAGHAYVYLIYGIHHCLNAVTGTPDNGDAVLLRAGEVVAGAASVEERRGLARKPRPGDLAGGPGKLCHGLAIDRRLDGSRLTESAGDGIFLAEGEAVADEEVARGPRIGVDYAGEAAAWSLRFAIRGHREMSRPRL